MEQLILLKVIKVENAWFVTFFKKNYGFEFQDYVCNSCYNLTILSVNVSDIAIITVKNVDYCCIIYNIGKYQAMNL